MNIIGRIFGLGRAAPSRDFRPEDLPETRVRLFFDTLKVRWSAMVGVNLLYIVFWLPAIVWTGVNLLALGQLPASAGSPEAVAEQAESLIFTCLLILWPLVALTGPATAGASFVLRNWARGEHSFVVSDFFEQFRKNWKQALGVSTITGALPALVYLLFRFYAALVRDVGALFVIPQAIVLIAAAAWLLMLEVVYTLMITYRLTFRQLLRNALMLSLARLPQFLGARLLTLLYPAAVVLSLTAHPGAAYTVLLIGGFFYAVFGLALNRLLYASLANAVC
jgi:uncharacterized membrane protein YesL